LYYIYVRTGVVLYGVNEKLGYKTRSPNILSR